LNADHAAKLERNRLLSEVSELKIKVADAAAQVEERTKSAMEGADVSPLPEERFET
jgi:hypothetical protein